MKKIFIVLLIGLFVFTGCGKKNNQVKESKKGEIVLTTTNGTYNWMYTIEDPKIVGYDSVKNDEAKEGKITQHFYFKGLKAGETKIIFEYYNVVKEDIKETKYFDIIVDKNLNVKVK